MPYPIDPYDIVLEEIIYGDKKVSIFKGGYAIRENAFNGP